MQFRGAGTRRQSRKQDATLYICAICHRDAYGKRERGAQPLCVRWARGRAFVMRLGFSQFIIRQRRRVKRDETPNDVTSAKGSSVAMAD
jgi:hypothetical protein